MKKVLIAFVIFTLNAFGAKEESEHPPLSQDTKEAIARYQHHPTPENKEAILQALTKAYDNVIAQKQEKLAQRIKDRDKAISQYLSQIKRGQTPPFLNHSDSTKSTERANVAAAIKAYKSDRGANEAALKSALEAYYDAFLDEQRAHIDETIALKDSRLSESLERFSKGFRGSDSKMRDSKRRDFKTRHASDFVEVGNDEILFDIMRVFVSSGAEFAPINPENRVQERGHNARINAAIKKYETSRSVEDKNTIKNEIYNALQNALKVRSDGLKRAEQKGVKPAKKLLEKMRDNNFLSQQKEDLITQRNLYGRIDRIITFGSLEYKAVRAEDSKKLFAKLMVDNGADSKLDSNAVASFEMLYKDSIIYQKQHLESISKNLDSIAQSLADDMAR